MKSVKEGRRSATCEERRGWGFTWARPQQRPALEGCLLIMGLSAGSAGSYLRCFCRKGSPFVSYKCPPERGRLEKSHLHGVSWFTKPHHFRQVWTRGRAPGVDTEARRGEWPNVRLWQASCASGPEWWLEVKGEDSESPLDCKESKAVSLKGNQPWIFTEGLMLKLQYFCYIMQVAGSLEKTLMLRKTEGRRRGWQRTRWLDGITESMNTNLSRRLDTAGDRGGQCAAIHGVAKSQTWLSDWTTTPYVQARAASTQKPQTQPWSECHAEVWISAYPLLSMKGDKLTPCLLM